MWYCYWKYASTWRIIMKSETLKIILNNKDFILLSEDEKLQSINDALKSLKDSLKYGVYFDRKSIIEEIKYLEELKKNSS